MLEQMLEQMLDRNCEQMKYDEKNVAVVLISGARVSQETSNRILKFLSNLEEGSDKVLALELPPGAKVKVRFECTTCQGRKVIDCYDDCTYWGGEEKCGFALWPDCRYIADGRPCPECNGLGVKPVP